MIFFRKPYYNPNYTNPNKKKSRYMPQTQKTYTNYIMQKKKIKIKNIGKNLETKA